MSSEFQNLIKTKSIGAITPQQILAAGENIFLDIQTSADINAINKAIPAYANIHSPNFGQPIPLSGAISSGDGSKEILAPGNSEVRKIIAISCLNNGGAAPIVFDVTLGGMIISMGNVGAPGDVLVLNLGDSLYASKNLPLAIAVTSGTAGDLTSSVASILITQ
jgi:hypothetical protein